MQNRPRPSSSLAFFAFGLVLIAAFLLRLPLFGFDLVKLFSWKTILHDQMAQSMVANHSILFADANYVEHVVSEAVLPNWYLALNFAAFGPSLDVLRIAMITLSLLTILVLFVVVRRGAGEWIAVLAALLLATMPLAVEYSGHAFGESFIPLGQLMLVAAACLLLQRRFSILNAMLFLGVCVYLTLAKFSTGALHAAFAFLAAGVVLYVMHRPRIRLYVDGHRVLCYSFGAAYILVPLAGVGAFVAYTYSHWGQFLTELPRASYYAYVYHRWFEQVGFFYAFAMAMALLYYLLYSFSIPARRVLGGVGELTGLSRQAPAAPDSAAASAADGGEARGGGLTVFEKVVLGLFVINVLSTVVQAWAFRIHDYYVLPWMIPTILLAAAFLGRVARAHHCVVLVAVGLSWVTALAYSVPFQARTIERMYARVYISQTDRDALRSFFSRRKYTDPRYMIIAQDPQWAYFGNVAMQLVWSWQDLTQNYLSKSNPFILKHNIEYVVYPNIYIPAEVMNRLRTDPLIDLGRDHYKLGLVLRGVDFQLFKITDGIKSLDPLPYGQFAGAELDGWTVSGPDFKLAAVDSSTTLAVAGAARRGNMISAPFDTAPDALLYDMKGGGGWLIERGLPVSPGTRVELIKNGEVVYRQYPLSVGQTQLYACDLGAIPGESAILSVVDSSGQYGIAVGNFRLITYRDIPGRPPRHPWIPKDFAAAFHREGADFMESASFGTFAWPGQPAWSYIQMDQDRLVMSAHVVGDPGVTELRVRLLAGTFRCSGKVSADAQSSYPLTLRLALRRSDGTTSTLTEMSLNPGQASDLNQTFKVDAPGTELSIRCALPAGAANNYNAKIYFDNLVLESVTKAD